MTEIQTLSNGLTVIVEELPFVESAAYSLLIPGGIIHDAGDRRGACLMLAEITSRGAGGLSSREISEAFESCGIRHAESAGGDRFGYRGSLLGENIGEALRLVSLMVREPAIPEGEIEPIRSALLQDISSLKDNPAHWAMEEISKRYLPDPYSRSGLGTEEGIKALTRDDLLRDWKRLYHPKRAILSVAGKVKAAEVYRLAESYFGTWDGSGVEDPKLDPVQPPGTFHLPDESAQLQIAVMYPSADSLSPHFYAAKVAGGILSGGFSGRLFIEVREKRGLCYSVYASHNSDHRYGRVTCYAGTTPERAQETLDVLLAELRRLNGTVTEDELRRAKANLLAAVIINEESTGSRAANNAADWWVRKRIRTLDEIKDSINGVTVSDIDSFTESFPPQPLHVLTLGSRQLTVKES